MRLEEIFLEATSRRGDLPPPLREGPSEAIGIEVHTFDKSYLEFLDEQIRLEPRGLEWSARLKRRRTAVSAFVDRALIRGRLRLQSGEVYSIEVDPNSRRVVYCEKYEPQ
jgi:hypothetical protein